MNEHKRCFLMCLDWYSFWVFEKILTRITTFIQSKNMMKIPTKLLDYVVYWTSFHLQALSWALSTTSRPICVVIWWTISPQNEWFFCPFLAIWSCNMWNTQLQSYFLSFTTKLFPFFTLPTSSSCKAMVRTKTNFPCKNGDKVFACLLTLIMPFIYPNNVH